VVKRTDPDYIEIRQYKEMRVAFFRSYGENAQQTSERKLLAWAAETGLPAPWQPYRCYITYRFDSSESSDYWWEAGVSIDRIPANPKAEAVYKMIGFGLYACLPAKAWGSMQGVVERVHRWLSGNAHYAYDESRDWLIEYDTLAATMDGHSSAVCAIPVMRNSNGGFVK
ncbi:MAG: hypothetical protein J7559_00670, partial [Cohnella sp.]|nr:hypothetical protein [Cohnella sp.]